MTVQRGFTLVELMVATAVASIVTGGVFFVMTNQTNTNRQQAELVEVQQNIRAAISSIEADINDSGFGIPPTLTVGTGATFSVNNVTGTDVYGTCLGTDVFTVRSRDPVGFWSLQSGGGGSITMGPGISDTSKVASAGYTDNEWPIGTMLLFYPSIGKTYWLTTAATRAKFPATGGTATVLVNDPDNKLAVAGNVVAGSHIHVIKQSTYRVICAPDNVGVEQRTLVRQTWADLTGDGAWKALEDLEVVASDIEDMQVEYLYDKDRDNLPDAASPKTPPVTNEEVTQVKAISVSIVGRSARPIQPTAFVSTPINIADHTWSGTPSGPVYNILYRYGRRMLRQAVLLPNRNTRDPLSFPYISNQWL